MKRYTYMTKILCAALLSLFAIAASADLTVTYFHNDLTGSPVAATNEAGAVIWRKNYTPYGAASGKDQDNRVGYTGHQEEANGLVYAGARYYDPALGRFLSVDPVGFDVSNLPSFNRYAYANNNPYKFVDPDGRLAFLAAIPFLAGLTGTELGIIGLSVTCLAMNCGKDAAGVFNNYHASDAGEADGDGESGGETNPYNGPVDEPVIVVDGDGNAIPVGAGEQIGASDNGDYQQVKDREGNPTGVRLDRGGHRGHADPKARAPHGHRPGVTDEAGNPHLPLNSP